VKKLLLTTLFISAAITSAFAAPLCTAPVTLDTLLTGGANAASGCEITDKIFSNFSYTGNVAASSVIVTFQSNGPIPGGATISFQPGVNCSAVSLTFTTTVDTTLCANCRIINVLDQIFTPPTPNSVSGTFTHTGGSPAAINLSGSSPATLSGQGSFGNVTSTVTTFNQTGGTQLQNVQSSFTETTIPEPATFVLLGGGLLALSMVRRKKA
jgi:hypothetical protein